MDYCHLNTTSKYVAMVILHTSCMYNGAGYCMEINRIHIAFSVCVCVCVCVLQGTVIVETVLSNAISQADMIVEAVVDNIEIKKSIFRGEWCTSTNHTSQSCIIYH